MEIIQQKIQLKQLTKNHEKIEVYKYKIKRSEI